MESLLVPGIVVCIVGALGVILWQLFKKSEPSTFLEPDENESDGASEKSSKSSRVKRRPYHLRNRQRKPDPESAPATVPAPQREEQKKAAGAKAPHVSPPVAAGGNKNSPAGAHGAEGKKAGAGPTAASNAQTRRKRNVSFSEIEDDTMGLAPSLDSPPTALPSNVARPETQSPKPPAAAASSAKETPKSAIPKSSLKSPSKTSPVATKVKSSGKSKAASRDTSGAAAASSPASVSELARLIQDAHLPPSDAQELVDVLLSTSSKSTEWVSLRGHGRAEETLASVKQARDNLSSDLDESRTAHRSALEMLTAKKAEHAEAIRQLKINVDALQKALTVKAKEVSQLTAKSRKLEEELEAKPVPVVSGDVRRYVEENSRLKGELESAQSRLADAVAECATIKQGAKSTEATLNNQLQQAKSNAEKQQKRAKDLDKQLHSDSDTAKKVSTELQGKVDRLEQEVATLQTNLVSAGTVDDSQKTAKMENENQTLRENLTAEQKKSADLQAKLDSAQTAAAAAAAAETVNGDSVDPAVLAKYDADIEKLQKDVEMWKADAKKFEDRLNAANAKNTELRENTWKAKDEAALAKKTAQMETKKTIDGLKARQRDDAKAEREQVTKSLCALHPGVQVASDEQKTLTSWVEVFAEKAKEQMESSASGAKTSSEELDKLRAAAAASAKEVEVLEARVKERDASLLQVQESLNSAQGSAESDKQQGAEVLKALEADLKKAQSSEEALLRQVKELESQSTSQQKEVQALTEKCKKAEAQLVEAQKDAGNRDQVVQLEKSVAAKDEELRSAIESLQSAETQMSTLTGKLSAAEKQAKTAEVQLSTAQSDLAATRKQLKADSKTIEDFEAERRKAANNVAEVRSRCSELEDKLAAAEKDTKSVAAEKDRLSSELDETVKRYESLDADRRAAANEIVERRSQCAELESKLEAAQREVDAAVQEKKRLSGDVDEIQARLSVLQTAMSTLQVEKRELEAQKREISGRMEALLNASASASTDV